MTGCGVVPRGPLVVLLRRRQGARAWARLLPRDNPLGWVGRALS